MKVGTDGVLLGAWARGGRRILDIGTGSGLVALMMAQRFPHASVMGVEIDPIACAQAAENMAACPFADRLRVTCGKIQEQDFPRPFDAIVCNPPFYADNSLHSPDKRRAMARNNDSLPFSELFRSAAKALSADGCLSLVIPMVALPEVQKAAVAVGLHLSRRLDLRSKPDKETSRLLLELTKQENIKAERKEETIYSSDNVRSPWYQSLTHEFYLTQEELAELKTSCHRENA